MQNENFNLRRSIMQVAPTICDLFGITGPARREVESIDTVMEFKRLAIPSGENVERMLVYAPDAIGDQLRPRHEGYFEKVKSLLPLEIRMVSVIPPKTPVAFASMFTGVSPAIHGIKKYERFVLTCDTVFDSFIRAGLSVAIAAVADSSIDIIFRERKIDYFSEPDDASANVRAVELLERNEHNLVVVYNQAYDDALHATSPFDKSAIGEFKAHVKALEVLVDACETYWNGHNRAVAFTPDHGAHFDPEKGRGDHCLDIPDDMNLSHYYGIRRGCKLQSR